jgi:hypothetical protein
MLVSRDFFPGAPRKKSVITVPQIFWISTIPFLRSLWNYPTGSRSRRESWKQYNRNIQAHEVSEGNPVNAGRLTGFMHFAFGDQRLAVGSRPPGRRWQVRETMFCLQGKPGQFRVPPCIPPPKLSLTDEMTDILHCIAEHFSCS